MHLRKRARHGSVHVLIALVALMAFTAMPASAAKKLSGKQRSHARAQLLKQIKRHPGLIRTKAFARRAALVNFKLPVSIRLRDGDIPGTSAVNEAATRNTNRATIDLGPSLGRREVEVGGTLIGQITFKDSFDGGALGNVEVDLLPSPESSPFGLTTTSVPLLWNTDTNVGSSSSWLTDDPGVGCGNFTGNANVGVPGFGAGAYPGAGYNAAAGLPVFSPGGVAPYASWLSGTGPLPPAGTTVDSYLSNVPGVDGVDRLTASKAPGNNDALGGNATPFPGPADAPGGFVQPPDIHNTVLRTNALALQVAQPGTAVDWAFPPDGAGQGSQNYVIGKSGGQANLFGNIPGKAYGIDVKINLATKINSIMRMVDPDFQAPVTGQPWPSTALACRQVWSGYVQNYLLGITLAGSLKISPGITSDGRLRIAKATLNGLEPYRIPLAACLQPSTPYAAAANGSDVAPTTAPTQPLNPAAVRPAPTTPCNSAQDQLLAGMGVGPLSQASVTNGYTVPFTGAQVTVTGDISIDNISADILIGDIFG